MNTTDFMQMSHANCAMKAADMSYEIETLRRHLDKLQAEGQVDRHEPEQRGTGFFVTWTRREEV